MSIEIPTIEEQEIKHDEIAKLEGPMLEIFKEVLPNYSGALNWLVRILQT